MVAPTVVLIIVSVIILPFLFLHSLRKSNHKPNLPPGPKGLPIIGNLHQLNSSSLNLDLWHLSKQYGPLFSLKFGLRNAIVVSSSKMVKETLKNHDMDFSGRPSLLSHQKLSYNGKDIIFSQYNDYWRDMRKLCVIHLFSLRRVSSFSSIRHHEVQKMITKISAHSASAKATNLNETLTSLTSTIICRVAFGRSYEDEGAETSRFHGMFTELQAMIGSFFFTDYIPFMGWMDRVRGLIGRLERNFKELDEFYQQVIDEHLHPQRKKPEQEDLIDVLLQLKNQNSPSVDLTIDHIKAIFMNVLAAATDTTAIVSVWAMTLLMKNPRVMQRVQAEVRDLYGMKGFIEDDDIQNLPYLKAVVKETLRLHLPAPLLVPRETNKKCIIQGYEIPAKTIVYVNAWAIQRDPETWKDPEMFYPERFFDSEIDFKGQDFELIPFGVGRRMCPGMSMGVTNLELIIANLVYSFDWEMPQGMKREDIDTQVLPGISQQKKNPLFLVARKFI